MNILSVNWRNYKYHTNCSTHLLDLYLIMLAKLLFSVNLKTMNKLILYFCVRLNTPSAAVYGELVHYLLYISLYTMLIFQSTGWRLLRKIALFLKSVCRMSCEDCMKGKHHWVSVRELYDYGFNYALIISQLWMRFIFWIFFNKN